MPEGRIATALQTVSQALIVGAGLVYLFGFLIVSIFDATYGIADFSLFRTKVIAVGGLFVFLVALAMVVTFRMFSLFGLTVQRADISALMVTPQNRSFIITDVALSIPFAAVGMIVPLYFVFSVTSDALSMLQHFGLFMIPFAIVAGLGVSAKKWFNTHPVLFVSLSFLNSLALLLILFEYAGRSIFWFVVWFSLACFFTLITSLKMQNPDEVRKMEWERMLLMIIPAMFVVYATKIYPNIRHQFGGGESVPIVLHLAKKLPAFDSETVPVSLIDETEQGYYVIRGSDKAVFVTRGLVEEVEFLRPEAKP